MTGREELPAATEGACLVADIDAGGRPLLAEAEELRALMLRQFKEQKYRLKVEKTNVVINARCGF
jgi:hypothetical protein